jgi:hypothetical protein
VADSRTTVYVHVLSVKFDDAGYERAGRAA